MENTPKIRLGSTAKIKFKNGEIKTFTVVDSSKTNPANGFISSVCPIGQALIGATIGEKRAYEINGNEFEIEITEIT